MDPHTGEGASLPTLNDLHRLALTDPIVHAALTRYEYRQLSLEQALMMAVVMLSKQNTLMKQSLEDLAARGALPSGWRKPPGL